MAQMAAVQPLRVLQVLGNAIVGGMETYVERLVSHLAADEVEVFCVCPFESPLTLRLRNMGIPVSIVRMSEDCSWNALQLVCALVRRHGIGIIHCHLANAHLLGALTGKLTDVPVLATVHGRTLSALDFEVQRTTDTFLVTVCEGAYLHALGLGVPDNRLFMIPNGVDTRLFGGKDYQNGLHEILGLAASTRLVGFVGRLSPEKGPEVFVRSAATAIAAGTDAHFVLIGEGPMKAMLARMVKHAGLDQRVHFAGPQREMNQLYPGLACVVSSSHSEGMPLAVMEAMASARPVIGTNVGGIAELIEQGETGYLVPAGDSDAIAAHLDTLLSDEELRQRFGRRARDRVMERFPFEQSASRVQALLRSLTNKKAGARVGVVSKAVLERSESKVS